MGQGAFAHRVQAEYMGERKGLHIRRALNPGLPNPTNAQERAMRDFKETGEIKGGAENDFLSSRGAPWSAMLLLALGY